ncbi:LytR C-terminal domain-containing protein [Leucobacter insecticola]|uniref:LytR C-terminal domain-containing protein n=1 Tax=Leucobacter insecticola TaxID=2714934 RepID=UPI001FCBA2D2|nr:LytR C-terminal domain-containing protein [Leucobacter insecticola]
MPLVGTATPGPEPQPKADAVIDPNATVVVLNGTSTPNLAESVSGLITDRQWGQIVYSGSASETDVELSAVFYMDPADEAAAEALATKLGGISSYQTDRYVDYGVRLVVLIGANYAGPGLEGDEDQTGGAASPEQDAAVDPETGYAIDPETGKLVDPETGQLIDRATQ